MFCNFACATVSPRPPQCVKRMPASISRLVIAPCNLSYPLNLPTAYEERTDEQCPAALDAADVAMESIISTAEQCHATSCQDYCTRWLSDDDAQVARPPGGRAEGRGHACFALVLCSASDPFIRRATAHRSTVPLQLRAHCLKTAPMSRIEQAPTAWRQIFTGWGTHE